MIYKRIPAGVYAANCYLIIDEISKKMAIIDPGGDSEDLIKAIEESKCKPEYILLTHGHMDHVGAVDVLRQKYGLKVAINKTDEEYMSKGAYVFGKISKKADLYLKEGDIIEVGSLKFEVIETPGHTPGGVCFLVGNCLLTGDTLFKGSIGRSDFEGGDGDLLIKNIKAKLLNLPENTKVLPGHMGESSIGFEKVYNPFF